MVRWCTESLTDIAEEHGQEDEAMSGSEHHYAHVHPEVEYLEYLRLGETQH